MVSKIPGHGIFTRKEMKNAVANADAIVNGSTFGSQVLADALKLVEARRQTDQLAEALKPLSIYLASIDASMIRIAEAHDRRWPKRPTDWIHGMRTRDARPAPCNCYPGKSAAP